MSDVTQWMVDQLVKPEQQYKEIKEPPLDAIRMAWPFKTEEEREVIRKWLRHEVKAVKKKQLEDHVAQHGKAFL